MYVEEWESLPKKKEEKAMDAGTTKNNDICDSTRQATQKNEEQTKLDESGGLHRENASLCDLTEIAILLYQALCRTSWGQTSRK